ncbi:MAG: PA2779 family protein [Steroidobacteraceae bacterium]
MRIERFRRACVALVSLSLLSLGMQAPAMAGVIGTSEAMAAARGGETRGTIDAALARDDVRAKLAELGVDASAIEGRLAALSETELQMLADQIEQAPAGGDALAVIGIVFVVLMILEFTGVIDIFKKA